MNEFIGFNNYLINVGLIDNIQIFSLSDRDRPLYKIKINTCDCSFFEEFFSKEVMDARFNEIKSMLNILKPGCALGELIEGLGHS